MYKYNAILSLCTRNIHGSKGKLQEGFNADGEDGRFEAHIEIVPQNISETYALLEEIDHQLFANLRIRSNAQRGDENGSKYDANWLEASEQYQSYRFRRMNFLLAPL